MLRIKSNTLKTEEMLSAFQVLYIGVIFTLVLNFTLSIEVGCADWSLSDQDQVCCKKCKPGNRLVQECGRDPQHLCTPCDPGYYIQTMDYGCKICSQCIGVRVILKNCTSSSDTVCGCKAGYRCGDAKCSFCVVECKKGEEPKGRTCTNCPEGKFNDKIHSMCKELTTSCPEGQNLKKGNRTCDSMCIDSNGKKASVQKPLPTKHGDTEQKDWRPVFIAIGMAGIAVLMVIASVISYVKAKKKTEKSKKDCPDEDTSSESRIMVVEQEDCSYRHPEQEQGGSSESINTQNSESKLIV